MKRRTGCNAKQYSDQMQCSICGLAWDVNDPERPNCVVKAVGNDQIATMRETLAPRQDLDAGLLYFQQMPLTYLPGGGIAPGLFRVNWSDYPELAYTLVEIPDVALGGMFNMRIYKFFTTRGIPQLVVQVDESGDKRKIMVRYHDERGNAGPWQPA